MSDEERASILSHEERTLAARLEDMPDASPAEVAAATDRSEDSVVKAIDRIRTKTRRAYATLLQSPFAADLAEDLSPAERASLVTMLDRATAAAEDDGTDADGPEAG